MQLHQGASSGENFMSKTFSNNVLNLPVSSMSLSSGTDFATFRFSSVFSEQPLMLPLYQSERASGCHECAAPNVKSHVHLQNFCVKQYSGNLGTTHQFSCFLLSASEAMNDSSFSAYLSASIFAKALLAENLNEIGMRSSRMKEERKVILFRQIQLCSCHIS